MGFWGRVLVGSWRRGGEVRDEDVVGCNLYMRYGWNYERGWNGKRRELRRVF